MAIVWDGLVAKKFVLKDTNTSRNRRWNMKDITNVSPPPPGPPPPPAEDSESNADSKISNDECLYCKENGTLLVCEYLGCPLVAHGECDNLTVKETKRLMKSSDPWFCPDHRPPPPIPNPLPAPPASDASAAVIAPAPAAADAAADQGHPDSSFNPIPNHLPADLASDASAANLANAAASAAADQGHPDSSFNPVLIPLTAAPAPDPAATATVHALDAAATAAAPAPTGNPSAAVGQAITFVRLSETLGFLSMRCGAGLHKEVPTDLQNVFAEFQKMIEMHLSKQTDGVAAAAPPHLFTGIPMQPPLRSVAKQAQAQQAQQAQPTLESAAVPFNTAAGKLPPRNRNPPPDRDITPPPAAKRRHVVPPQQ